MNTNPQGLQTPEDDAQLEYVEDEADALMQLLEELDNINENSEKAPLNRSSIDDNNDGRIELIKRQTQKLPVFLLLRRLRYIPRKLAKTEQGDGT